MSNHALEAIVTLAEVYKQELSEAVLRIYTTKLADLDQMQVSTMLNVCLASTERFLPPPGVLREMAGAGVMTPLEEAEQAWAILAPALDAGSFRDIGEQAGRIRHVCMQLGGIAYLTKLPMSELQFRRTQFLRLYQSAGKQLPAIEDKRRGRLPLREQLGLELQLKTERGEPDWRTSDGQGNP